MAYWDTSALLKLYVSEADSPYFLRLVAGSGESITTSSIASAELLCVLYRKERARALKPGGARRVFSRFLADTHAGRILTIPFGRDVEVEAEKLMRLLSSRQEIGLLRSLDLIHVSSALSAGTATLVATDARLRDAAAVAGLRLLP